MVFRGYRKGAHGVLEHWISAEAFERRRLVINAHRSKNAKAARSSPEARSEYNREMATYMRKARRLRPETHMLTRVKRRAKERNLAFDLSVTDIHIPQTCPILGIALFIGDGAATDNSPELDRIDNSMGYVRGNVHVISRRANRIKSDATADELALIASFLHTLDKGGD